MTYIKLALFGFYREERALYHEDILYYLDGMIESIPNWSSGRYVQSMTTTLSLEQQVRRLF